MRYLLGFLVAGLTLGCSKEGEKILQNSPTNLSASVAYKQIEGINPNLLSLDIYYNDNTEAKKPVVIYVHGGGWSIGDKANQLENKINLFRSLEYILVSINYRLSPFPYELNNPERIMYPTHNEDVAAAIKWVVNNISQYGGNFDKIALLGHSAGAHLVALTGTNEALLKQVGLNFSNIKGVAVIDTEGYDVVAKVATNNDLYINAFGMDSLTNVQASPIFNITDGVAYPHFFIAKRGSVKRIAVANQFIEALEEKGVSVFQVDGGIYDHQEINLAIGAANEVVVTSKLQKFLTYCFD